MKHILDQVGLFWIKLDHIESNLFLRLYDLNAAIANFFRSSYSLCHSLASRDESHFAFLA
jgi:hypothetical protein